MSLLYARLKAIACHVWGCSPWEFERAARRGDILLEDVWEAVILESFHIEVNVGMYIRREREAELQRRHEEIVQLSSILESTKDEERAEELRKRIRELNQPVR